MDKIILFLFVFTYSASAWFLPYANPNKLPYPKGSDLDTKISGSWESYKTNYIESNGLVFKKYDSEYSNSKYFRSDYDNNKYSVSEGIGYAMLIALYLNDQQTFDLVYSAGKKYFGYPSLSGAAWKVSYSKNNVSSAYSTGSGSATDGDVDVATALIFASELAKKGYWTDHNYSTDANTLVDAIYNKDQSGGWLKLGTNWGGANEQNPSYFAPGYLRLYDKWKNTSRWGSVISNHYSTLKKNPGYSKGIIRNWCNSSGGPMTTGDYWSEQSKYMSWEAIRVPWRIAVDGLWYSNSNANSYANNAMGFASDPENLGTGMFLATSPYGMQEDQYWLEATPKAMWGGLAGLVSQDLLDSYADGLCAHYALSTKQFNEDDHYFTASLTLLGALVVSGSYANVYEDLQGNVSNDNSFLETIKSSVEIVDGNLDLSSVSGTNFYAKLSKATSWTVSIKGETSGVEKVFTGYGTSVFADWSSFRDGNSFYVQGENIVVTVTAGAIKDTKEFVLYKMPSKYVINCIDDFEDLNNANNYNADWKIITDNNAGGNSSGSFAVESSSNGSNGEMKFEYSLNKSNASKALCGLYSYFSSDKSKVADFKNISYFKLRHKGDACRLELIPSDDSDNMDDYFGIEIPQSDTWEDLLIQSYKLEKVDYLGSWSTLVSSIKAVRVVPLSESGSGTIYIDDLKVIGSIGLDATDATLLETKTKKDELIIYPNPFNPVLNILYSSRIGNNINVSVYNVNGKLVKTIYRGVADKKELNFSWIPKCSSGIYYVRLKDNNRVIIKSSVLIK